MIFKGLRNSLYLVLALGLCTLSSEHISAQCSSTISSFPYQEGFESGLGLWTQSGSDNFDWTRDSGGTPSSGTGPSTGASGSTWYMYTEASTPNHPSRIAIFDGPCLDLSAPSIENAFFSFDYHMLGTDVGVLDFDVSLNGSTWTTLETISGNQGNSWNTQSVDLCDYIGSTIYVRFHATTGSSGNGWSSDISIDNINVTTPSGSIFCTNIVSSFPYTEDFESGFGFWAQGSCDDFDMTRDSGGTPSNNTGPSSGASGSTWYIYSEASTPNHPSRTTIIMSPCFDFYGCYSSISLEYDYHMYGSDVGSLTLQIATENSTWTTIQTESGNKGNSWLSHIENLDAYVENIAQLRFVIETGSSGSGWSSDIALDNIQLSVVESSLADADLDGIIDAIDIDDDNDGIPDYVENNIVPLPFTSQMQLNGDATSVSSTEIQLTPATLSQGGSAFALTKVDFSYSFSLRFEVNLGTNDVNGADGMALVFHNDPDSSSVLGVIGQGLGAAGIQDGIVLEIDIWDNGAGANIGDISNDHTMIWDSDIQTNNLTTAVDFGNLEDGMWHDVLVYWDAMCYKLAFTLDDIDAGQISGNLIHNYFGGANLVNYGFTASTGGAVNDQRVRNVNILTILDSYIDTDNDSILDQFDLDSDNDGIWDADEADHGLTVTSGRVSGAVGVNGLLNSLETSTDSDSINYSIGNSEVIPDMDYDPYELDADNDGCFDSIENGISDSDKDGLAGSGSPTVDSLGQVTSISYINPSNTKWQNPLDSSSCLTRIWINPFTTSRVIRN